jgi:hypothetical protein
MLSFSLSETVFFCLSSFRLQVLVKIVLTDVYFLLVIRKEKVHFKKHFTKLV